MTGLAHETYTYCPRAFRLLGAAQPKVNGMRSRQPSTPEILTYISAVVSMPCCNTTTTPRLLRAHLHTKMAPSYTLHAIRQQGPHLQRQPVTHTSATGDTSAGLQAPHQVHQQGRPSGTLPSLLVLPLVVLSLLRGSWAGLLLCRVLVLVQSKAIPCTHTHNQTLLRHASTDQGVPAT